MAPVIANGDVGIAVTNTVIVIGAPSHPLACGVTVYTTVPGTCGLFSDGLSGNVVAHPALQSLTVPAFISEPAAAVQV